MVIFINKNDIQNDKMYLYAGEYMTEVRKNYNIQIFLNSITKPDHACNNFR